MISTITHANNARGMFRAVLPDGGYLLIELLDAVEMDVGHELDIADPTDLGEHQVMNRTTGESIKVYFQNYGGLDVGQQWFE